MSGYQNPVKVHFGRDVLQLLPRILNQRTCAVITSPGMTRRGILDRLRNLCGGQIAGVYSAVEPNPTVDSVMSARRVVAEIPAQVIVAIGGGSVLDTAKAIAAQQHRGLPISWLASHLREGALIPDNFLPSPMIAIPTTAGTGSEVTMWATIWDDLNGKKYSLFHPSLYPEAAIVDPDLTLTVPEETTVAAALDALSHSMEAIWNRNANPVSDTLATHAISLVLSSLQGVLTVPSDISLREKLHYASMIAGLAFSNTRTAIAHSISYPLTGQLGVPHGIACSFTLPEILRVNGESHSERIAPIIRAMGCHSLSEAINALQGFLVRVGVPGYIKRYFHSQADVEAFYGDFITPGRADNNVVPLTQSEALELFRSSAKNMLRC